MRPLSLRIDYDLTEVELNIDAHFQSLIAWLSTDVAHRNLTNLAIMLAWADALTSVVATYSRSITTLRSTLMANNIFGALSGLASGAAPTALKHLINLPINYIRLREMKKLIDNVNKANEKNLNFDWLKPFMHPRLVKKGEYVFRNKDLANQAFIVVDGDVEIIERGVILKAGEIFGELALFTGSGHRTASAKCITDVRLLYIEYNHLEQLYFQNPEFGLHLIKLIVRRSEATRLALQNGY